MGWGPGTARRHVDPARIGIRIGDELGNSFGRNRWMYRYDVGLPANAGDRRDVADEVEIELVVERRIDQICPRDKEERVAVRRRAHDRFGADIAATAWPVLYDEWLAEPLRQLLTDEARQNVLRAAGGNGDDQAHRPRRIRLRPSDARKDREYGSTCRQTQKLSAGRFHPSLISLFDQLVGAGEQRRRNFEAKRLGGRQVDDELELGRLHDRQVGGVCAF